MYEHVEDIPVEVRMKAEQLTSLVEQLCGRCSIDNVGNVSVYLPATKQQLRKNINGDFICLPHSNRIENNIQKALEFVTTWQRKWSLINSVKKIQVKQYVKTKLGTNDVWALNALIKIYGFQTANEQAINATTVDNNVGFTGIDAEILSSIAKQLITRIEGRKKSGMDPNPVKCLSEKQRALVRKKMPKYWQQIIENSDEIKLLYQTKHFFDNEVNSVQTRLPI